MCRGQSTAKPDATSLPPRRLLLVSTESYMDHEKEVPGAAPMITTGGFVVAFLLMIELTLRQVLVSLKVRFESRILLSTGNTHSYTPSFQCRCRICIQYLKTRPIETFWQDMWV